MDRSDLSQQYEIRVKGHLDERLFHRFEDLTITLTPAGETILAGPVIDQAALYGLLNRIRDLGLELLLVQRQPDENKKDERDV
ncbi:MAG: hypothetical protein H6659_06130 [Ardenticatenaceae bacterium]|nr:hypothetical protein [Ardenticatenaceae bacterium]